MNNYETLYFKSKEEGDKELENQIQSLVQEQLDNPEDTNSKQKLQEIEKYVEYSVSINDTCSFDIHYRSLTGDISFDSAAEYFDAKETQIWGKYEADRQWNISWDGDVEDGDFSLDGSPDVKVTLQYLGEDASQEAKKKEEHNKRIQQYKSLCVREMECKKGREEILNLLDKKEADTLANFTTEFIANGG